MEIILSLFKKIVDEISKLTLEDKLKKESNKSGNLQINPLDKKYFSNQLVIKKKLYNKFIKNNLLTLEKLTDKHFMKSSIELENANEEVIKLILNLIRKEKFTLKEKEVIYWYLSSSKFMIKNRRILNELNKYIGTIEKNNIFKNVYKNDNYSRKDAADYANKYYYDYNKDYPNFGDNMYEGGDCANFISQCLYAGGMQWIMINNDYANAENWWCKPGATDKDGDTRITLSWKTTYGFKNHWQSRAAKYSSNTAASMKKNWSNWLNELERGDAIQLADKNSNPWHTLIICDYAYKDFKLAAHTNDTNSALFNGYILEHRVTGDDRVLVYQMD